MATEMVENIDEDEGYEVEDEGTWLLRLRNQRNQRRTWEKYVWVNRDNCVIRNSIIKFNVGITIQEATDIPDLINYMIISPDLLKRKTDGRRPSNRHGNISDQSLIKKKFYELIRAATPLGYTFHEIGFFIDPLNPTPTALFGNVEIKYKKNTGSGLFYAGTSKPLNRVIVLNIHVHIGDPLDFKKDIEFECFSRFQNSHKKRDAVRHLSELSPEKRTFPPTTIGSYDIYWKSHNSYDEYMAAKLTATFCATEPLSPPISRSLKTMDKKIGKSKEIFDEARKSIENLLGQLNHAYEEGYISDNDYGDLEATVTMLGKQREYTQKDLETINDTFKELNEMKRNYCSGSKP